MWIERGKIEMTLFHLHVSCEDSALSQETGFRQELPILFLKSGKL